MNESRADPLSFARDMKRLRKPLRLRGRWSPPLDGLWKVVTRRKVHGGFLICRGRVVRASPAVRRYIHRLGSLKFAGCFSDRISFCVNI